MTTQNDEEQHCAETPPPRSADSWILGLVTASILMVATSTTLLNVALPTVARHFDASSLESTWLLLIPVTVSTCLLLTFGRISDMIGRREMFLGGLGLFTLCAFLAGTATSVVILIAIIGIQAVGSAMVISNTGTIVGSVYAGPRLSWAMGIYLTGVSTGRIIGPSAGGLLADGLGWRWLFWTQVPLGVLCFAVGMKWLRALPPRIERSRRLDIGGALALTFMVVSLLFAIASIQSAGVRSWQVLLGLLVFVALIPVLVFAEASVADPILQVDLLRRRSFLIANVSNFLAVVPRCGTLIIVGLFFQIAHGDSPLLAGIKVIPFPIGIAVGSLISSRCASWWGIRRTSVYGSLVTSVGLVLLGVSLSQGWAYGFTSSALVIVGVGSGVFATLNSTLIIGEASPDEVGTVNGIRLTLQSIGGAVGLAGCLAIATSALPVAARSDFFQARVGPRLSLSAVHHGFNLTFATLVVIALASGLALLGVRRKHRPT